MPNSVHLQTFPDVSALPDNAALVAAMDKVREVCNAGLSIRSAENIRIRQPLASVTVYGEGVSALGDFAELIQDELNVKSVSLSEDLGAVADLKLTLNFKVCGKRFGPKMKEVGAAAKGGDWKDNGDGTLTVSEEILQPEEFEMKLEAKEGITGAQAVMTQDALVVLDLEITPELASEGIARDLVRAVQEARKQADLVITDRIELAIEAPEAVKAAAESHQDYIKEQTLALDLAFDGAASKTHTSESPLDDATVKIGLQKAA